MQKKVGRTTQNKKRITGSYPKTKLAKEKVLACLGEVMI